MKRRRRRAFRVAGWAALLGAGPWAWEKAWGAAPPPAAVPDLWGSLLRMGASLAAVLGILLLAVYALRRFGGGRFAAMGGGRLIRVVGTQYLGGKNHVSVVEVDGERFLLGVSAGRITLLSRLDGSQANPAFSLQEVSAPGEKRRSQGGGG
ncbi:MAG: flagellar biosynthetic protein FliO [Candidatus Tectomicrobia bacterium]|nr:flagellar biosynthetic protein FliO [Candidatus Tectomicrobia bacterium]